MNNAFGMFTLAQKSPWAVLSHVNTKGYNIEKIEFRHSVSLEPKPIFMPTYKSHALSTELSWCFNTVKIRTNHIENVCLKQFLTIKLSF